MRGIRSQLAPAIVTEQAVLAPAGRSPRLHGLMRTPPPWAPACLNGKTLLTHCATPCQNRPARDEAIASAHDPSAGRIQTGA